MRNILFKFKSRSVLILMVCPCIIFVILKLKLCQPAWKMLINILDWSEVFFLQENFKFLYQISLRFS